MFVADPTLARDWLKARLQDQGERSLVVESELLRAATQQLDPEQRSEVLAAVRPAVASDRLIAELVGEHLSAHRNLLQRHDLEAHWTAPLQSLPDTGLWRTKALLALDAGASVEEVAAAPFDGVHGPYGSGRRYWGRYLDAFRELEDDEDPRLQQAARCGIRQAEALVDRGRERELRQELYGVAP